LLKELLKTFLITVILKETTKKFQTNNDENTWEKFPNIRLIQILMKRKTLLIYYNPKTGIDIKKSPP
jgi:hypothetical protein